MTKAPQAKLRNGGLYAGQKFGDLTVIQRVADIPNAKSPTIKVRYRFECSCGQRLTLPMYYVTRKSPAPKTHCGCKTEVSLYSQYPQEYGIWMMMHVRTENPSHVAFKHYGGRGIRVCPEWHKDRQEQGFRAFLEFVGPRPSPKHTIDRVDNDLGYQPYQGDGSTRQVRWATPKEQRANQRPYKPFQRKDIQPS